MSTLLLPAVAVLVLPGSDDGGAGNGPLDVTTPRPDRAELAAGAGRPATGSSSRRSPSARPSSSRPRTPSRPPVRWSTPSRTSSARPPPTCTGPAPPNASDARPQRPRRGATSDVLYRQALAERADRALEGVVVRAERTGTALAVATDRVAAAQSAVDAAADRADGRPRQGAGRRSRTSVTAVTAQLAALGAIPAAGQQQERNKQAMLRWQTYLGQLAAAGIEPPSAADTGRRRRPAVGALPRAGRGRPAGAGRRLGRHRQQPVHRAARRDRRGRQHGAVPARQALRPRHLRSGHLRLRRVHLRGLAAGRVRRPRDAGGPVGHRGRRCP